MGKFNVNSMRYLQPDHFRILLAVEMGMKNHELVPLPLISSIAAIHRGATFQILNELAKHTLIVYERGKRYDGYRLTTLGYDFLALRALNSREVVGSVGNKIGVGKESDIYVAGDPCLNDLVLKFHRLGRTSFRKLKEKRDYHQKRHFCSWLYLSRIAALKEFSFLKALYLKKFPVPKPIDVCRHLVVMSLIEGKTLCHVDLVRNSGKLFDKLMNIIMRLASYGLIHGDFNEFNIMLTENEEPIIIDFPQMISIDHPNAKFFFDRDVECVRNFFQRKFNFYCLEWPKFDDIERRYNLDIEVAASGFTKKMENDLNKAYDEGKFNAHLENKKTDLECDEKDSTKNLNTDSEHLDSNEINEEFLKNEKNQNYDHELRQKVEGYNNIMENELEKQKLKKETRFDKWLKNAQLELEKMTLTEINYLNLDAISQENIYKYNVEEQKKIDKIMHEDLANISKQNVEKTDENSVSKKENTDFRKAKTLRSIYSNGSTIAPEDIKKKLLKEKNKTKKQRLKTKGKQCAVNRGRRDNIYVIKECKDWDDY